MRLRKTDETGTGKSMSHEVIDSLTAASKSANAWNVSGLPIFSRHFWNVVNYRTSNFRVPKKLNTPHGSSLKSRHVKNPCDFLDFGSAMRPMCWGASNSFPKCIHKCFLAPSMLFGASGFLTQMLCFCGSLCHMTSTWKRFRIILTARMTEITQHAHVKDIFS